MTLFTSVINSFRAKALKTSFGYLLAAVFCALFGGVYEVFSHGVYSGYMLYAFGFPLVLGALPFLLLGLAFSGSLSKRNAGADAEALSALCGFWPKQMTLNLYHCGILTLTVGSFMKGVLEIYGTTNSLGVIYWIAGAALLLTSGVLYGVQLLKGSRN